MTFPRHAAVMVGTDVAVQTAESVSTELTLAKR